jgi:predicted nucleic acid-binding Zn ribbon protein
VPPKRKIERISATIEKLLARRGLSARIREYRVFGVWDQAVGDVLARHAQPGAIRGKKLTVTVDSSAWMQQLSLLKPEIIEKLNRLLGGGAVESITLRLGEISPSVRGEAPRPLRAAALGQEERSKIEEAVRNISDPTVRDSLRHLMEKDFLAKQATRRS